MKVPFIGDGTNDINYLGHIFGAFSHNVNSVYIPMSLKTVRLSKACKSIKYQAFTDCMYVEKLIIPDSVIEIDALAIPNINITIYCEENEMPNTWNQNWNYYNKTVVWGYKE